MTRIAKASLLLGILLICGSASIVTQKLRREEVPPPAPHELFALVNQQLSAFRSADFGAAYRHAATGVQQKFTLPQFEKMVRERYPTIVRAQRVEFGLIKIVGESAAVQVFFFAGDGSARSFLYILVNERDSWKIEGVEELDYRAQDQLAGTHA